jgi:hypothetical protein
MAQSQRPPRVRIERDLIADLAEQRGFLQASAGAYDSGQESEAKRLALHLRVLLHDTRQQQSLLTRLGVRDTLPWTDTSSGPVPNGVIVYGAGLAMLRMHLGPDASISYAPPLADRSPERFHPGQAFIDWWREPVLDDAQGNQFSRADLVLAVADQDGGAHIDDRLTPAYAALSRGNSLGFTQEPAPTPSGEGMFAAAFGISGGAGAPLANSVALANVRQIAWEVEDTLQRHLVAQASGVYVKAPICSLSINDRPAVGNDDPCPCGSKRKFRNCFARRQPRNPALSPMLPTGPPRQG